VVDMLHLYALFTQNRHPMTVTHVKSVCNAVIAMSFRR
jgi:hypothetical protein